MTHRDLSWTLIKELKRTKSTTSLRAEGGRRQQSRRPLGQAGSEGRKKRTMASIKGRRRKGWRWNKEVGEGDGMGHIKGKDIT